MSDKLAHDILNSSSETLYRFLKHQLSNLIAEYPLVLQQPFRANWEEFCQWRTLNKEMLGVICGFLSWQEIVCRVLLLSRHFAQILRLQSICWTQSKFCYDCRDQNQSFYWKLMQLVKPLTYEPPQVSRSTTTLLPYSLKYIKKLKFYLTSESPCRFVSLLPYFKFLSKFRLISCTVIKGRTNETIVARLFSKVLPELTQLQSLDVNALFIEDVVNLEKCTLLRELCLRECIRMSNDALAMIGQSCPNLTRLTFAELYQVSDELIRNISSGCPNLMYLKLSGARDYILDELSLKRWLMELENALLSISHFQSSSYLQVLCLSAMSRIKKDVWISFLNHLPHSVHTLQITYCDSFDLFDCSAICPVNTVKALTVYIPNSETLSNLPKVFPNLEFLSLGEQSAPYFPYDFSCPLFNFNMEALASVREFKELGRLFIEQYSGRWSYEYKGILDQFPENTLFEKDTLQTLLDAAYKYRHYNRAAY